MPEPTSRPVADRRQVVAVLRLVVSGRGQLLFGEAIDVETERGRRFTGWRGLAETVRAVVSDAVARPDALEVVEWPDLAAVPDRDHPGRRHDEQGGM